MSNDTQELVNAVLTWARTPGPHGGNPYGHEFVKVARRLDDDGGDGPTPESIVGGLQAEMVRGCNPNADPYEVGGAFTREAEDDSPDFERILRVYAAGDDVVRGTINDTLISLCGWSLHSLIRKAELLEEAGA
jgi:hypothetical protein